MVQFLTHCLLKANFQKIEWKGVILTEGEFISGRKVLADETGLSEQQIRTCIKYLKSTKELTTRSTKGIDGKYTVFKLESWKKYQDEEVPTNGSTKTATKQQPRVNQGSTKGQPQDKNEKNEKNDKNIILADLGNPKKTIEERLSDFRNEVLNYRETYDDELLKQFYEYWSEHNPNAKKMRFEKEKTWDLSKRLKRWSANNFGNRNNKQLCSVGLGRDF